MSEKMPLDQIDLGAQILYARHCPGGTPWNNLSVIEATRWRESAFQLMERGVQSNPVSPPAPRSSRDYTFIALLIFSALVSLARWGFGTTVQRSIGTGAFTCIILLAVLALAKVFGVGGERNA